MFGLTINWLGGGNSKSLRVVNKNVEVTRSFYILGGGNWFEMVMDLKIDVKHTGPTAIVVFTSNLNEGAANVLYSFILGILGHQRLLDFRWKMPW